MMERFISDPSLTYAFAVLDVYERLQAWCDDNDVLVDQITLDTCYNATTNRFSACIIILFNRTTQ